MENLDRRSFLGGMLGVGALAAAGSLTACSEPATGTSTESTSSSEAQAFESLAQPITPESAPTAWDSEADVVVVGSGGGGLTAAIRLATAGKQVILVEKASVTGGETRFASYFVNLGGHRMAEAAQWAYPSYPYDPSNIAQYLYEQFHFSGDPKLLKAMATAAPKVIDWLQDETGVVYMNTPFLDEVHGLHNLWINTEATGTGDKAGFSWMMDTLTEKATELGVQIMTSTTALTLLEDEQKTVVGIKVEADGVEQYLHATTAVLLTAGGFLNNRPMVKKYCPQAYDGTVSISPWTKNTGDCVRMGMGAGADLSGYNCMSCYDGGILHEEYGEYDTEFQVAQTGDTVAGQPWLMLNRCGERVPYFDGSSTALPYSSNGLYNNGFAMQSSAEMAQPGGRAYVCFDSKYRANLESMYYKQVGPRYVSTAALDDFENNLVPSGAVKKADTIEELESMLGLQEGMLTSAVEKWNDACDKGEDYVDLYKYDPAWLVSIDEPPYYGAIIGGQNYETKCGLRINENMQVLNTNGLPIEGLYAGWHTAGGSQGELNLDGIPFCGWLGNNCLSFTGGYMAADAISGKN